jgi:hypothetical protein
LLYVLESPTLAADESGLQAAQRTAFWSQSSRPVAAQREKLRAALEDLYATSSNLASYVEQNRTGFRKILKKHDKLVSVSAFAAICAAGIAAAGWYHGTRIEILLGAASTGAAFLEAACLATFVLLLYASIVCMCSTRSTVDCFDLALLPADSAVHALGVNSLPHPGWAPACSLCTLSVELVLLQTRHWHFVGA